MTDGPHRAKILATREIEVKINGVIYDAMLIPRESFVEIDYTQFPEDDPMKREINADKMATVELQAGVHIFAASSDQSVFRLTKDGARLLLEQL